MPSLVSISKRTYRNLDKIPVGPLTYVSLYLSFVMHRLSASLGKLDTKYLRYIDVLIIALCIIRSKYTDLR